MTVELAVREGQTVRVALYDALGREVCLLHDGPVAARETRTLRVETASLASGTYFVRAVGEEFSDTRALTVVR